MQRRVTYIWGDEAETCGYRAALSLKTQELIREAENDSNVWCAIGISPLVELNHCACTREIVSEDGHNFFANPAGSYGVVI